MTTPRIFVAAPIFPWPPDTGARMRVAHIVRALAQIGSVDLLVMAGSNQMTPCDVPAGAPVSRVQIVRRPPGRSVGLKRLAWAVGGVLPVEMSALDFGPLRAEVAPWLQGPYDATLIFMPELFVALRPLVQGALLVDLYDLEDQKGLRRLGVGSEELSQFARVRRAAAIWQGRRNAHLWRRLYEHIGRHAAVVTVCSDEDKRLLGLEQSVVVPNGYQLDGDPLGSDETRRPPSILFQGSMVYAPNVDAARLLALDIAPAIRKDLPAAEVRIVGRHHDLVARLHDPPAIVVTGHVPDLSVELARADLVAVPLRYGSGTRIKILEAFAHRIPVVSTAAGAEGLDVVDGVHLLIRDGNQEFASGCVRVLRDQALRRRLVANAEALFSDRYRWTSSRDRIVELVRLMIG